MIRFTPTIINHIVNQHCPNYHGRVINHHGDQTTPASRVDEYNDYQLTIMKNHHEKPS